LFGHPNPALYSVDDKEAATALQRDDATLLKWNPFRRKLAVIPGRTLW